MASSEEQTDAAAYLRRTQPDAELLIDMLGIDAPPLQPPHPGGETGRRCPTCNRQLLASAQGRCRRRACVEARMAYDRAHTAAGDGA